MHTFEFWVDQGAVKNEEDFQTPDAVATASSVEEAASLIVPQMLGIGSGRYCEVYARDTTSDRWFTLELTEQWTVTKSGEKTFAEVLKDFEG